MNSTKSKKRIFFVSVAMIGALFLSFSISLYANTAIESKQENDVSIDLYVEALPIYNKAILSRNKVQLEEALRLLHNAYQNNPFYFEVVQALSRVYFLLRDNAKAKRFAQEALFLRTNDFSSRVLLKNISILESMDISAEREELVVLEKINQYDKGLLLTHILYYSLIGNFRQVNHYLILFKQVYPDQSKILNIHTLINAIASQQINVQSDRTAEYLFDQEINDIYVVWLLSEYYYLSDNEQRLTGLLNILLQSGYFVLEKIAFQKLLEIHIIKDFDESIRIAREYTQRYPFEENSWFFLGYTYYIYSFYLDASVAFKQGFEFQKNNDFLLFMHDIALRDGGESLVNIRELRVQELSQLAENSILEGKILQAKAYSRRALLIHPLAEKPLFLLANIYQSEGYTDKSNTLFSLLKNRQGTQNINKELEYLLESNTQALRESLQKLQVPYSQSFTIYPWNIEISSVSNNEIGKSKFLNDLVIHILSQYEMINVENIFHAKNESQLQEEHYLLEIDFTDNVTLFRVNATLYEKRTENVLFLFSATGYGNDRIVDAIELLGKKIAHSFPILSKFTSIDKNTFFLSAGKNVGVSKESFLPIYNRSPFKLSREEPYAIINSEIIGFANIKDVYPTFSVGSISNSDGSKKQLDPLNLLQNLDRSDIVLIPPRTLYFEKKSNRDILLQQKKHLLFSSLYYTMLFNIW